MKRNPGFRRKQQRTKAKIESESVSQTTRGAAMEPGQLGTWARNINPKLSISQVHYLFSASAICLFGLVWVLIGWFRPMANAGAVSVILWGSVLVFMAAPLLFDLTAWLKAREALLPYKLIFAVVAATAVVYNAGEARQMLNEVTRVVPNDMTLASTAVALVLIPISFGKALVGLWDLGELVIMVVCLMFLVVFLLTRIKLFKRLIGPSTEWARWPTMGLRVAWSIALLILLSGAYNQSKDVTRSSALGWAGLAVFELEMYSLTQCTHRPGERVLPMQDGKALRAMKGPTGRIEFDPGECVLKLGDAKGAAVLGHETDPIAPKGETNAAPLPP